MIKCAPVAGAAYPKTRKTQSTLTHAVEIVNDRIIRVLCGRVKPEHILDDWALMTDDLPTCTACQRKVKRIP